MEKRNILKKKIEDMSIYHQTEILRIFSLETDAYINENKNGTFINLSEQSNDIIYKLEQYCVYVDEQQKSLEFQEKEKLRLQKTYFKADKDSIGVNT